MQKNTNKTAAYKPHPLMTDAVVAFEAALRIMGLGYEERDEDVAERLFDHAKRNVAPGIIDEWFNNGEAAPEAPQELTEHDLVADGWSLVNGMWQEWGHMNLFDCTP